MKVRPLAVLLLVGSTACGSDSFEAGVPDQLGRSPNARPIDFAIGPYVSATDMLDESIALAIQSLDASTTYGEAASQGRLLHLIALRLPSERSELKRQALLAAAEVIVEQLNSVSSTVVGGGPAFGLDRAWDAFGDGTTNPAFTAYAWQSSLVLQGVAALLAYARAYPGDVRPAFTARLEATARPMVALWARHYSEWDEDGERVGFFWYSVQKADAIAVHNTSAILAVAHASLARTLRDEAAAARATACARLLAHRLRRTPTAHVYWNYADDFLPLEPRPDDIEHVLLTAQLLRWAVGEGVIARSVGVEVATTLAELVWSGDPVRTASNMDGRVVSETASIRNARFVPVAMGGVARLGRGAELFAYARATLFSSYLSRFSIPRGRPAVDVTRALAVAFLLDARAKGVAAGLEATRADFGPPNLADVSFNGFDGPRPVSDDDAFDLVAWPSDGASFTVAGSGERQAISITYLAMEPSRISLGGEVVAVPASFDEDGTLRWRRTAFVLEGAQTVEFEPGVWIHEIERIPR